MSLPVAIFASGSGSNLQAILDYEDRTDAYHVALVITDRECRAEDRAKARGCDVVRIPVSGRTPEDVGMETLAALSAVDLICLAGYTRHIPESVTQAFADRILNVHPALLPAFGGQGMYGSRVHEAVLESGAKMSGPTIHLVNENYDEGTILAQWPVPVLSDDTPETLAARVLAAEHLLFPVATAAVASALSEDRPIPPFHWRRVNHDPTHPSHTQNRMREAFTAHE